MSTPSEESGHRGQWRPFGQWANGANADGAHAKKQAAAALWLAHHLLPGVRYREAGQRQDGAASHIWSASDARAPDSRRESAVGLAACKDTSKQGN